jgi:hypothetical protein
MKIRCGRCTSQGGSGGARSPMPKSFKQEWTRHFMVRS